jgi:hypothetical protein
LPARGVDFFEGAFFALGFCAKALPADDLDALLVRPSRRTFDAALAALSEVVFFGAFVCDSALPAADFDDLPVGVDFRVFEADFDALFPVTFDLGMLALLGLG